ncbi:hypothetical protein DFP72DRAFT_759455, partial [Ephemerocybe angulata]
ASIERRWGKTDQELFILAVFLNPYIWAKFFNTDHLSFMTLFHIARRAVLQLTRNNLISDPDFLKAFTDYYHARSDFSKDAMCLDSYAEVYDNGSPDGLTYLLTLYGKSRSIDIMQVWQGQRVRTTVHGRSALIDLALRVLSIVPNSASTECLFSMFGSTHTKHCNRLAPEKVHQASVVRLD